MKLKGKALLSLLIVLTLLVQLFAVSASAAYGESLTYTVGTTDGQDVGGYSVAVGSSMADLVRDGLSITPPDGYFVQSAWIEGGDGASSPALPLTAAANGSASIHTDGEVFADHSGSSPVFNDALLASRGGAYTLHVLFAPLTGASVEIRGYDGSVSYDSAYTPSALWDSGFIGWELRYDNGSSVILPSDTYIAPYASCHLSPAYAQTVTLQPQAKTINAGDPVGDITVDTYGLPYGMRVQGGAGYCADGDYPSYDSTLCVGEAYLVYNDGSPVPSTVAVLEKGTATITVVPAPLPVHEHSYGEPVQENIVEATCTAGGQYDSVVYCSSCGEQLSRETVYTDALGHSAGEPAQENVVDATCTAGGQYDLVTRCIYCGEEMDRETVYTDALGHSAGEPTRENEVAATCSAEGRYDEVVRCTVCGEIISSEARTVPALGHTPGEPTRENEVPATCEAGGSYDEVVRCTVCGEEISRQTVTTDPLGHNWGEWTVTKPATEAEEGVETRVCGNNAEHVETRAIPKLDHVHSPVKTEAVAASCETDGTEAYWTCSSCGKLFSDEACTQELEAPVVIPATGHNWGEWTVTKPATETEEGTETRVCGNNPEHVETRPIPPIGHTHSLTKVEAVAPSCEKDGSIEYYKCEDCGKLFKDEAAAEEIKPEDTVVPATGHDWGEWTVTKPATETEEGVETRTCKNDASHTETRPIPKTDHVHKLTRIAAVAPTYEKDGNIEYYSCEGCGKLFKDAEAKQEITIADTVVPKLSVTEVTVTVADQSWVVGSGTTLDQTRYTVSGFESDAKYSVTLSAPGYNGGAGEYSITAELKGYDTAKYHVTVIPGRLKVSAPMVYPLVDSANGYKWTIGSTSGLTLTVNADIRKFVAVKVDGAALPESNYIVSSGSTVITLRPSYLSTLAARDHAISIEFTDGSAATTFVVSEAPVVTPTPLTITGRNVSKAYDGTPYDLSSYGQNTQGITTQFHLAQNGQPVAQAINPGTYDIYLDSLTFATPAANGYNITIIDSSGQVVATNYQNSSVRIGTLTITGSNVTNVTVTVNDQSWTYDGTAHTPNAAGYTVSGLQGNDTITVKLSVVDANGRTLTAVTDAGTYSIKADCTGYDSSRYNVTVAKTGTLTVSPYRLTLTAESAVKNYDGSPLRNSNVKATALLSGHKFRANDGVRFSVYDSRGNLIQNGPVAVGTYTKKVTDVHIVDANGIEVTSNYNITRIDGTLTINNSDGSPKTGDTNKLTLWIVLLAVSALLILAIATLFLRRGRKGKAAKAAKKQAPKADTRPADKQ